MRYYIWKGLDGEIIANLQTPSYRPPPAIEVTKDEFVSLGFYREYNESSEPTIPIEAQIKALSDQQDFLEECIVEMATILYS